MDQKHRALPSEVALPVGEQLVEVRLVQSVLVARIVQARIQAFPFGIQHPLPAFQPDQEIDRLRRKYQMEQMDTQSILPMRFLDRCRRNPALLQRRFLQAAASLSHRQRL